MPRASCSLRMCPSAVLTLSTLRCRQGPGSTGNGGGGGGGAMWERRHGSSLISWQAGGGGGGGGWGGGRARAHRRRMPQHRPDVLHLGPQKAGRGGRSATAHERSSSTRRNRGSWRRRARTFLVTTELRGLLSLRSLASVRSLNSGWWSQPAVATCHCLGGRGGSGRQERSLAVTEGGWGGGRLQRTLPARPPPLCGPHSRLPNPF